MGVDIIHMSFPWLPISLWSEGIGVQVEDDSWHAQHQKNGHEDFGQSNGMATSGLAKNQTTSPCQLLIKIDCDTNREKYVVPVSAMLMLYKKLCILSQKVGNIIQNLRSQTQNSKKRYQTPHRLSCMK